MYLRTGNRGAVVAEEGGPGGLPAVQQQAPSVVQPQVHRARAPVPAEAAILKGVGRICPIIAMSSNGSRYSLFSARAFPRHICGPRTILATSELAAQNCIPLHQYWKLRLSQSSPVK